MRKTLARNEDTTNGTPNATDYSTPSRIKQPNIDLPHALGFALKEKWTTK
jgi:hypothetical protein